jgi:hypothetical protein
MNDNSNTSGQVRIMHLRGGKLLSDETHDNLIVTTGKNWQAARQKTTGQPNELGWMACGVSATAPATGDTVLGSELARVALGASGGAVSANVVTYQAAFTPGVGTGALTEIGLFNAASAGTMVSRATFPVKNKEAGDTLTFTWTHSIN